MNLRRAAGTAPDDLRPPTARTPDGTVVYAIGDIHGRIDLLRRILDVIRADVRLRPARRRVAVFLGDYINRGIDCRAVVATLMAPGLAAFEVVVLKGNNEDLMLRFLDGDLSVGANWLDFGGVETMAHYGMDVAHPRTRDESALDELRSRSESAADYGVTRALSQAPDEAVLEQLRRHLATALPQSHLDFFRSMRVAHREGGYYFVHAGIRPGVPLEGQTDLDRMWIRRRFLDSEQDHGVVVVHGHSVFPQPQVRHNRIGIDTGAYRSGVLTCLVLDGAERAFLQT